MTMDLEREAEIDTTWLTVKNYEFKILVMIACLAENKLAFRGKLKDMCEFLGVSNQANNNKKIQEAIKELENKKDIIVLKEGHTWTLTLTNKCFSKDRTKRIRNAYVKAIQSYEPVDKDNDSVSWENILRVLVFLCADKREIKTYAEIANSLGIAEKTVKRAVKALINIDFNDLSVKKKIAWFKDYDDTFKSNGLKYEVGYKFED
jgi:predicted transcriptional regulator